MTRSVPVAPRPRVYELLLSYACNAKCDFCYNPPITPALLKQEISLPRAAALLTRARAEGYEGVWLTGGEPTLRKDLPQLLLLSKKLGFARVQIGTNGVRLADERYARRLAAAGLNFARVSLHAARADLHDELLKLPGSFDAAVRAVANLRRLGVETGVNFVVTSRNYRELPGFFRFAARDLKVPHFDVIFLHHRGEMERHADALGVRYSAVAPWLRRAFRGLAREGAGTTARLVNIPPCVVPELERWIVDWAVHAGAAGDRLARPGGEAIDLSEMKSAQRTKAPSCARCALDDRCMGFEPEYERLYGVADFRPIRAKKARAR